MANRHLFRSISLQSLFEWDFRNTSKEQALAICERNLKEFASDTQDNGFVANLVSLVIDKKSDLDVIIEKAAPDWPIDKISTVDRNILRIGLSELLFSDRKEVPPKVAINEAIELAKSFGGETSGKFVNGVLGAVYKEMGEPGKEETSKRKFSVPDDEAPIERLGGAFIYSVHDGDTYLALVHDIFGHWTLSKGHFVQGEEEVAGLQRVIKEELGLDITVEDKIGDNSYMAFDPEKGKIKKQVMYFLANAPYVDIKLSKTGGLDDVRWFKLSDILDLNFYNDILPIITKAIEIIGKKSI